MAHLQEVITADVHKLTLLIFLIRFLLAGRLRLAFDDIFMEVALAVNWQLIMSAAVVYTKYGINCGDFL